MKTRKQQNSQWRRPNRRRGFAAVYFALMLTGLLGIAAMVVDMGFLYKRKSDAQKAADAAALAGAYILASGNNVTGCTGSVANATDGCGTQLGAKEIAKRNGYDDAAANIVVTTYNPVTYNGQNNANWFKVLVQKQEPMIFSGIFGAAFKTRQVQASATALFTVLVDIPLDPQYYGINGPVTYSQYGPDTYFGNGDPYSALRNMNEDTNLLYEAGGYNYKLSVPSTVAAYKSLNGITTTNAPIQVELFDPDCYNSGGQITASSTAVDELRKPVTGNGGSSANATTTQYTIYWDKNTPADFTDDVQVATASYGYLSNTDFQWVTPSGFNFDMNDSRFRINGAFAGDFRINVKTTAGSSENGFNLRAGKAHSTTGTTYPLSSISAATWHDQYSGASGTTSAGKNGTSIAAMGHLPMNFNVTGTADILLGYVPSTAAGGQFFVNKFDTDVGAVSVYYTCDTLSGQTFAGTLSANGQWKQDTITLPSGYTGGNWHAIYNAGVNDTSAWELSYSQGTGLPGSIRLVQ